MLPCLAFRPAVPSDATALHEIRQAAILQLSLTHLSETEASAWAGLGGIARVERAISNDDVWVATFGRNIVGWLHRDGNRIAGLYISPNVARRGVGTALAQLAETHIAEAGHDMIALESSLNAVGFYSRLGYAPTGAATAAGALPMRKTLAAP